MNQYLQKIQKFKQSIIKQQQLIARNLQLQPGLKYIGVSQLLAKKMTANSFSMIRQNMNQQIISFQTLSFLSFNMMDIYITPSQYQYPQDWINSANNGLELIPYYSIYCDIFYFSDDNSYRAQYVDLYKRYLASNIYTINGTTQSVFTFFNDYLPKKTIYPIIQATALTTATIWKIQQQTQRILHFVKNYFSVCTYKLQQAYEDFCCSYDILSPIINNLYKIQIQAQAIVLQDHQQHPKQILIAVVIQHQIYLCRCSIYSFIRGILLKSNDFTSKYIELRNQQAQKKNEVLDDRKIFQQQKLVRDLSYLYQNLLFVLYESMKRYMKNRMDEIISFLNLAHNEMPPEIINIKSQIIQKISLYSKNKILNNQHFIITPKLKQDHTFIQNIINSQSFQTIYSKMAISPSLLLSFLSPNQQNVLTKNVKALQSKLLKQKTNKYYLQMKQLFFKANEQINALRQGRKKIKQQNSNQKAKYMKIVNYLRNVFISIFSPIQQSKAIDHKALYNLQMMSKDLRQKQQMLQYQSYGIIYLSSKYQAETVLLSQYCQLNDLSQSQLKSSRFYGQYQGQQFLQIQTLYKQTFTYSQWLQHISGQHFSKRLRKSHKISLQDDKIGQLQTSTLYKIYKYVPVLKTFIRQNYVMLMQQMYEQKKRNYPFALKEAIVSQQLRRRIYGQLKKTLNSQKISYYEKQLQRYINQQIRMTMHRYKAIPLPQQKFVNFPTWKKPIFYKPSQPKMDESALQSQLLFLQSQFSFLSSQDSENFYLYYKKLRHQIEQIKKLKVLHSDILNLESYKKQTVIKYQDDQNKPFKSCVVGSSDFKLYLASLYKKRDQMLLQNQIKNMGQLQQRNQLLTKQIQNIAQRQKQAILEKQKMQNQFKQMKIKLDMKQVKNDQSLLLQKQAIQKIKNKIQQQQMQPQFSNQQIQEMLKEIKQKFQIFNTQTIQYIFKNNSNFQQGLKKYFQTSKNQNKQQVQKMLAQSVFKKRKSNIKFPLQNLQMHNQYELNKMTFNLFINFIIGNLKQNKLYPQIIKLKKKKMLIQSRLVELKLQSQKSKQLPTQNRISIQAQISALEQDLSKIKQLQNQLNTIIIDFIKNIRYKWILKSNLKYQQLQNGNNFRTHVKDLIMNAIQSKQPFQKHKSIQNQRQILYGLTDQIVKLKRKIEQYNKAPTKAIKNLFKHIENIPEVISSFIKNKPSQADLISILGSVAQTHQTSIKQYQRIKSDHQKQIKLIKCLVNKAYQNAIGVFKVFFLMRAMLKLSTLKQSKVLAPLVQVLQQTVLIPETEYFKDKTFGFVECFKNNEVFQAIESLYELIKFVSQTKNIEPQIKINIDKMNIDLFNNINSLKIIKQRSESLI